MKIMKKIVAISWLFILGAGAIRASEVNEKNERYTLSMLGKDLAIATGLQVVTSMMTDSLENHTAVALHSAVVTNGLTYAATGKFDRSALTSLIAAAGLAKLGHTKTAGLLGMFSAVRPVSKIVRAWRKAKAEKIEQN